MKNLKNKSVSIKIDERIKKDIKDIPKEDLKRIFKVIDKLETNPELGKSLHGAFKPLRRLKIGDYRVIYAYDGSNLLVLVIKISHRKSVYDELKNLIPYIKL